MDLLKAVTYLADDEDWLTKIGTGSLIAFVPVLNLAMFGYQKETIRRLQQGQPRPLPTWSDLSHYWSVGWPLGLAHLVYALPSFVLVMVMMGAWFGAVVGLSTADDQQLPPMVLVAGVVALGAMALSVLYSLLVGLFHPAVTLNYYQKGTFGACFDLGAIFGLIRQDLRAYLILCLAQWAIGVLLSFVIVFVASVVSWIPCIGQFIYLAVLGAYSFGMLLVQAHLLAQFQQALVLPGNVNNPVLDHP